MAVVVANTEVDYAIKPEAVTPSVDTSTWPLLLKNYEKRLYQRFFCLRNDWGVNLF